MEPPVFVVYWSSGSTFRGLSLNYNAAQCSKLKGKRVFCLYELYDTFGFGVCRMSTPPSHYFPHFGV